MRQLASTVATVKLTTTTLPPRRNDGDNCSTLTQLACWSCSVVYSVSSMHFAAIDFS